jgi:adenylate cyclase
MAADESGTLARLTEFRAEIIEPKIAQFHGRIVGAAGDSLLVEFSSAISAVQCAIEAQEGLGQRNADLPEDRRMVFRMGVNLGDVIAEGNTIHGDGVNIASRLEKLAEPGGICIGRNVYDQVKGKLPCAYTDLGEQQLHNIPEPVRVYRVRPSMPGADAATGFSPHDMLPLPDKPSIAVLPFANMSGDPEQEFFADGLTEDIITALSRVSGFWVIARTSTFTYKARSTGVKRVAEELGVRYVMEGSVRRAGDRLRVTAQLLDATHDRHVWAERYDRALADLFDIQDEITRSVAASIQTQIDLAEGTAAASRSSTNLKARDLVARAWARQYDQTSEAIAEASDLVESALLIDPVSPVGHRVRATVFFSRLWLGEIPNDLTNRSRAMELARTALRLAPRDEYAHLVMAWAWAYAEERLEEAILECERGLEINPSCSILFGNVGAYQAALGRPQEAIEACRLSLRLNPRDPSNFWRHYAIAVAHFVAADYAASLQDSKSVARSRPHLPSAIIWAASAAALGKTEEVRAAVEDCLAQRPDLRADSLVPGMLRFARKEDHERLLALLRQAGLPE